jgi:hypothetical protein
MFYKKISCDIGLSIFAAALERSPLPRDRAEALDDYLAKSEAGIVRTTIDKYDIYLIK